MRELNRNRKINTQLPKSATIRIPRPRIRARYITIDDIDSFGQVARIRVEPGEYTAMAESRFKNGIAKILGEGGKFKDWGGERNDLYTNRVRISDRRLPAAFAFKGVGTRGILTPRLMGKNGDQIATLQNSCMRCHCPILGASGRICRRANGGVYEGQVRN